jgi:hypothetical protein
MRKLLSASLIGSFLVVATSMLVPAEAEAGSFWRYWRTRFSSYSSGVRLYPNSQGIAGVPMEPSVPEPGAAALFAIGAGVIAARSRRRTS